MRKTSLGFLVLATVLTAAACASAVSPSATIAPRGASPAGAAPAGAAPAGASPAGAAPAGAAPAGEANNGEALAIRYTDSRGGYRVDAPGPMTAAPDGTASYVGPLERLEVAVRTGTGLDPAALASADLATLRSTLSGFRLVSGPTTVQLGSRRVQKLVYAWTAGTSAVTGKPVELMTARYYIAKDTTKVAVLTYAITSSQYDPQGADDVALTFGWS